MTDRRRSPRQRTFLGAQIAFNKRASSFDCIARNLTPEGARLAFSDTVLLPELFDLTIEQKGLSIQARIVWRSETELGVAFVGAPITAEVVPIGIARRLNDCEREKQTLQRRLADAMGS